MEYIERVLTNLKAKNADQSEFIQAVEEVLESLEPVIKLILNMKIWLF